MIKKLLASSLYAFIAFCVLSYFSVMYSLLQTFREPLLKPVANIGVPFTYYKQLWYPGYHSQSDKWTLQYFAYDVAITWVLTTVIYLLIKRKKRPPTVK